MTRSPEFYEAKQPSNELMEEVQGLGSAQIDHLRKMGRTSIYVMAKGILGYRDVNQATHGAYCKFFEECPKLRRLGLMPRAHLKTTLATIADSTRLAVDEPDQTRILVLNETFEGAADMVEEIKGHFEKNRLLRQLYPDVVPEKFTGPGVNWGYGSATVKRTTVYKEGTWTAGGVGSALVGGHYTRIKPDDLIGFEASRSPTVMQEAIDFIKVIEPLLTDQHQDIIDFTGTRWAIHDLYAFLIKFYGTRLAVFAREAIEGGQIIFPQKHTLEEYHTLMTEAPATWYAQYRNNPLAAGQTDFPTGAVRAFRFSLDGQSVELLTPKGVKRFKLEELDRVITVDPNSGEKNAPDEAAVVVSGVTPDDDVVVLDEWGGRVSPSKFVDKIYEAARRWDVRVVGIEQVAMASTRHYFDKKAEEEDYHIRVEPLRPRNRNKLERIRKAVEPLLNSRRVYMLATQVGLRGQVDMSPQLQLFDRLDAFAYGPEIWRKGMRIEDIEENDKVLKLVVSRRNPRTGY